LYASGNAQLGSLTQQISAGISLSNASNCNIEDNVVANSECGIFLSSSSGNSLKNNNLDSNIYGFGVVGSSPSEFVNKIDESNTVNGRPIIYWINRNNQAVPSGAGYAALIDCANMTIQGLELSSNYNGLLIVNSQNSTIEQNAISGDYEGIRIISSSNNIFKNNAVSDCVRNLLLNVTELNSIDASNTFDGKPVCYWIGREGETVPENSGYVALVNCSGITIQNLNLANSGEGITLLNTSNSKISNNTISNMDCAITVSGSSSNDFEGNTIANCDDGIVVDKSSNSNGFYRNILDSNLNNGIKIANSSFNIVLGNEITKSNRGLILQDSSHNTLQSNVISENTYGLQFTSLRTQTYSIDGLTSLYNVVFENNFTQNSFGIGVPSSAGKNSFFHNNFVNNTRQAYSESMISTYRNSWDNGSEGNYWSDYTGVDNNYDKIGDSPLVLYPQYMNPSTVGSIPEQGVNNYDVDHYPLMQPFATLMP
jgi:parallel beta-helix repeat protein